MSDDAIRCHAEDCPVTLRWEYDEATDEHRLMLFDGQREEEVYAYVAREWDERGGFCREHSPYMEDHFDG
jgi:hypothetical protein